MFGFRRYLAAGLDHIRAQRDRHKEREARGLALLKEWLSRDQRAQFEALGRVDNYLIHRMMAARVMTAR